MKTDSPIFSLSGVKKEAMVGNNRFEILKGVDLTVNKGESLSIMGPSGSGKSTILHVLGLLTPAEHGDVFFMGKRVNYSNKKEFDSIRKNIGYIFQDSKLIPNLSVLDNVRMPLAHRGIWPSKQKKIAVEALEQVGLGNHLKHYPQQLSGGEHMRCAIARALCLKPKILLADEPTGSLDTETGETITKLLLDTVTPERSLVIVTHHPPMAKRTDRIVFVKDGLIDNSLHREYYGDK